MGVSTREKHVLKVVHLGRHVEFFREPITAREIMSRYPRQCLARPDFFEFPWIVVHPESALFLGEVFYLVPYGTIYKLLHAKMEYQQDSDNLDSKRNRYSKSYHHHYLNPYTKKKSPTKSLTVSTPKHRQQHRNAETQSQNTINDRELYVYMPEPNPDTAKSSGKSSWNKMRRNLHQALESDDQLNLGIDSPFDIGRSGFCMFRSGQSLVTNPKHAETRKSCLKKPDNASKKLKSKVSFAFPVVDLVSRRDSLSSFEQDA